jgi:hypothetical protein
VGTQLGVVAWIDTNTLRVVRRDMIPKIPTKPGFVEGFGYVVAAQAFQAANGKVLLFSGPGCCDVGTFFQTIGIVVWDPVAGTSTVRTVSGGGGVGGVVSASADHSKILVAGGGPAMLYDSATDQFNSVPGVQFQFATLSPTGSQFVAISGNPASSLRFFNLQMQQVGSLDLPDCCAANSIPSYAVYSPDGKSLYLAYASQSELSKLVTIDAGTFQVVGTAANLTTGAPVGGASTFPQVSDSTGLVFELADHGIGIVDANDQHNFQNARPLSQFYFATPDEGRMNQATTTQFTTGTFSTVPDVFFGSQRAINPNFFNTADQLEATAPPSSTVGPVNVKAVEANGVTAFLPQGFTYGALLIQYGSLASTPKGGVFADLLGYGFSVDIPGANI